MNDPFQSSGTSSSRGHSDRYRPRHPDIPRARYGVLAIMLGITVEATLGMVTGQQIVGQILSRYLLVFLGVPLFMVAWFRFDGVRTFYIQPITTVTLAALAPALIGLLLFLPALQEVLLEIQYFSLPESGNGGEQFLKNIQSHELHIIWSLLLLGLLPGILEELFFRGFLLRSFSASTYPIIGIFISSALFALVHYPPAHQVILMFLFGMFVGCIVIRGGGIFLAMGLHILYNSALFIPLITGGEAYGFKRNLFSFTGSGPASLAILITLGLLLCAFSLYVIDRYAPSGNVESTAGEDHSYPLK